METSIHAPSAGKNGSSGFQPVNGDQQRQVRNDNESNQDSRTFPLQQFEGQDQIPIAVRTRSKQAAQTQQFHSAGSLSPGNDTYFITPGTRGIINDLPFPPNTTRLTSLSRPTRFGPDLLTSKATEQSVPLPSARFDSYNKTGPERRKFRNNPRGSHSRNLLPRPQPTDHYLSQSSKNLTQGSAQKLLVIMDLNGCLLDRGKNKGRHGELRPHLKELLEYCFEHHKVMVWSSAKAENVVPMTNQAFGEAQVEKLLAIWDRRTLKLSATQYKEKVQVYKQLQWIWEDQSIQKQHPKFAAGGRWNQGNTVLIDDSEEKAAAQPHNQLLVPEYEKENVHKEKEEKVLVRVVQYLTQAAQYEDVSTFIQKYPFQGWTADS